jgi:hypothetical protein
MWSNIEKTTGLEPVDAIVGHDINSNFTDLLSTNIREHVLYERYL